MNLTILLGEITLLQDRMYETVRGISIDFAKFGHTSDAESVQSLVQKLQQEKYNPVLLYKEWGIKMTLYQISQQNPSFCVFKQSTRRNCFRSMP